MTMQVHEVGGCVRDGLLGLRAKDIDFTVVAESFEAMREGLLEQGFTIHTENPEFFTIRCGVPVGHILRGRAKDADFVWARREGPSSDGRHRDWVEPGTLMDDLERTDFTVNAMARTPEGELIDPFNGETDLANHVLRFVGDPMDRIHEDGLRVMRALRFTITKRLHPTAKTWSALLSTEAAEMLALVSVERVRDELEKMLAFDTPAAMNLMADMPEGHINAIFRGSLRLSATMRG